MIALPAASPLGGTLRALAATARQRVSEASLTTGIELGCVIFGLRNGHFNVTHPNGFTKGWAIVGQVVEQWQFGAFVLVFALVRGPVVLLAPRGWRLAFALVGLYVSLTVDVMIRRANPDSPVIPTMDYLTLANAWIAVSLICRILGLTWEMFLAIVADLGKGRRRGP